MIPFSPPRIDQKIIDAVVDVFRTGWISTGPKTRLFEQKLAEYCGCQAVHCVSSATAGLELMLHWFGVGKNDEVIVPAYTYCATAHAIVHSGAKPVMVDSKNDDFNIDSAAIEKAVTPRTKVIMPVDFAGFPCDYKEILNIVVKNSGYDIKTYPVSFDNYSREISLPVFYDLTDSQVDKVISAVVAAVEKLLR